MLLKIIKSLFKVAIFIIICGIPMISVVVLSEDVTNQNLADYSYGFFLANALAANTVFNIGRSNIYLQRHNNSESIYHSGMFFLLASIMGLISSAVGFIVTRPKSNVLGQMLLTDSTYFLYSLFIVMCSWLTCFGIYHFFRWFIFEHYENYFQGFYTPEDLTSDQALAELLKAKTKYDFQIITLDEYDAIRKELIEIIRPTK